MRDKSTLVVFTHNTHHAHSLSDPTRDYSSMTQAIAPNGPRRPKLRVHARPLWAEIATVSHRHAIRRFAPNRVPMHLLQLGRHTRSKQFERAAAVGLRTAPTAALCRPADSRSRSAVFGLR